MIAVDTNLLVFAHRSGVPEHRAAKKAIERASADAEGWGFAHTSVLEFWSVVTHPLAPPRPSTPSDASAFLYGLVRDADAHIWLPAEGFDRRLTRLASRIGVSGARIFDLAIALTALEAGAREIWTHDRNFLAVPGLRVVLPLRPAKDKETGPPRSLPPS